MDGCSRDIDVPLHAVPHMHVNNMLSCN